LGQAWQLFKLNDNIKTSNSIVYLIYSG